MHEPVPLDQGQHVESKGTVENVVVGNLSTASHDLMVFNVLVLNKEIQNHYEQEKALKNNLLDIMYSYSFLVFKMVRHFSDDVIYVLFPMIVNIISIRGKVDI